MARKPIRNEALKALMAMEPQLQQVKGLALVLEDLGTTADAIEPLAVAVLGQSLMHVVLEAEANWRTGMPE